MFFTCKSDGCDWPNKISIDVLIRLFCFCLGAAIVLFFAFCPFTAIADESFYIIDEINVLVYEIFLQYGDIKLAESLMS